METFRITELARRFDLARSTLLHYDHIGLLKPGGRTASGYRVYTADDLSRLERICLLRQAGLGLADIALILDREESEALVLERRLVEIDREAAALRAQQKVLAGMLRTSAKGLPAPGLDRDLWLDLQKACGLDAQALRNWHLEFERRSPHAHQDFLLGLGLSNQEAIHVRMVTKSVEGNDQAMRYFHELFEGIPRQGPGCPEATHRALDMVGDLPSDPRVLDVACGSGLPTRILARRLGCAILAIDSHPPLLSQLDRAASREGLDIQTLEMSMLDLPFEEESFDLVWAEGALFIPGLARGLEMFLPLVSPGGHLAFTEMCLFDPPAPPELDRWFQEVYPDIRTVEGVRELALAAGWEIVGDFRLPDRAWWDDYYTPMLARIEELGPRNAHSPRAREIYARCTLETEMFRKHSKNYGYAFFVLRRPRA